MNHNSDPTPLRDYELGRSYAKAIHHVADKSPKALLALLMDVLGDDRALLPPLRHLIESPKFQELMNERSAVARVAGQDTLLHELASWCNRKTIDRLGAFLAGTLGIPSSGQAGQLLNVKEPNTKMYLPLESTSRNSDLGRQETTENSQSSTKPTETKQGNVASEKRSISILRTRAAIATLSGDLQRGIRLLSDALRLDPAKASLYMQRAILHARNHDPGSAVEDFTSVLRLEPNNIDAIAQRGQAYALLGDIVKAINDWEKSASAAHIESKGYVYRQLLLEGRRLYELKDYHSCLNTLNRAARFTPSDAALHLLRGQAYQATANYGMAIQEYSATVKIDPANGLAYALRGKAYNHQGNRSAAIQDWKTAERLGASEASKWPLELMDSMEAPILKDSFRPTHAGQPLPINKSQAIVPEWRPTTAIAGLAGIFLIFLIIVFASAIRDDTLLAPSEKQLTDSPKSGNGTNLRVR